MLERIYRWFTSSLANQLLITYLVVITIALVVVSFWALVTIQAESTTDLRNSLEVEAVNLALEIDSDLQLDSVASKERVQAAVDRRATRLGVAITVVDGDGHVLADSSPVGKGQEAENEPPQNLANETEINDALAGIIAVANRRSAANINTLYLAYPVRSAGVTSGVVRVAVPLTEVEQRLRRDLIVFLEIILATGIITVLISLWLAERVIRPVKDMGSMAKQISISGDLSSFLPVRRRDEVGELSLSFNQMIGRLREQERLRQEFIANASHELKTPTMAIGSVVEALMAGAVDDPKLRQQFLASLEKMVDRQSSLIKDLLDISRLDTSAPTEYQDDVNVTQVISESVEQIRTQAEKKNVELIDQTRQEGSNGRPFHVKGDGLQLQRAIINILTNAVKFTPEGGKISILIVPTDAERAVSITIKDTGAGIPSEDIPHIFERFYRGDKSRAREAGGSGLGLAITREIIARHHGTIEVESTVGQGTTFKVNLPINPDGDMV